MIHPIPPRFRTVNRYGHVVANFDNVSDGIDGLHALATAIRLVRVDGEVMATSRSPSAARAAVASTLEMATRLANAPPETREEMMTLSHIEHGSARDDGAATVAA